MSKELKKLIDKAELQFNFLNKPQLKILKTFMELAHNQGKIDILKEERVHRKN